MSFKGKLIIAVRAYFMLEPKQNKTFFFLNALVQFVILLLHTSDFRVYYVPYL